MENKNQPNISPIKIAHIIGKWVGGGVEAMVMNYYRHIDTSKVQFHFLCDSDSTNIPYKEIESLGGKVILIPPYQKVLTYQKELKKILKQNHYQIVHSHINTLSVFPLRAAKKAGVKIRIAHSHSTTNKAEWKRNLIKQILRLFSKIYATHYMCCSQSAGRWLFVDKEYYKGNVYLLNNAIDLEKFEYNEQIRNEVRTKLEIDKNTFVVGHVGRFVKTKNYDFVLDVFYQMHQKNENTVLLLAGQGPLKKQMEEKVQKLNLTKYVKFLGQIDQIDRVYQAFDVFLLPSLYEGLGLVLIEAQCAGVQCIASEQVPRDAKITDQLLFISLSQKPEFWAEQALKLKTTFRTSHRQEAIQYGYDIKKEAEKLEEKYWSFSNESKEERQKYAKSFSNYGSL